MTQSYSKTFDNILWLNPLYQTGFVPLFRKKELSIITIRKTTYGFKFFFLTFFDKFE